MWGLEATAAELAPKPPAPQVSAAQAELGQLLFFDERLSGDVAITCATCHAPDAAWGDSAPLSKTYPGSEYFRNSRSLLNIAHNRFFFWDGRMAGDDMASQVRDQITETHFLNMDGRIMQERLAQVPEYVAIFEKAFGGEPSFGRTLNAIAAFEKTLVTKNAPLDRYLRGDRASLSASPKRGMDLFTGREDPGFFSVTKDEKDRGAFVIEARAADRYIADVRVRERWMYLVFGSVYCADVMAATFGRRPGQDASDAEE